jgi:hypothetical protein
MQNLKSRISCITQPVALLRMRGAVACESIARRWRLTFTFRVNEHTNTPKIQQDSLKRQLHFLSDLETSTPVRGMRDACVLLSPLPKRFERDDVKAGTVFIDTFHTSHRPCGNTSNYAMVYCVGPEGDQAHDASDFIHAGISTFAREHGTCVPQNMRIH